MFKRKDKLIETKKQLQKVKQEIQFESSLNSVDDIGLMKKIYDKELIKIQNPNLDIIKEFGYCYKFSFENIEDYSTKTICIKYKDSDDWVCIFSYQSGIQVNDDGTLINLDRLLVSKELSKEETLCIISFIKKDINAMNLFDSYLEYPSKLYDNSKVK